VQSTAGAKGVGDNAAASAPASNGRGTDSNRAFTRDIFRLIWEYRGYSIAISLVTVVQEISALWPVALLGQFVDRLATGDLGNVVWLLFGSSLLYPAIVRGNVMLRHKMFYDTEFQKRVELTLKVRARSGGADVEETGAANTRIPQAVSGIANATYHVLGSFTPVVVKIVVVAVALIAYNRILGLIYLASLIVPTALTLWFNHLLRALQQGGYSLFSRTEGIVIRALIERGNPVPLSPRLRAGADPEPGEPAFVATLRTRRDLLFEMVWKGQWYLYIREACLVGSQFLVVFVALAMRQQLGLTPGDFTRIIGYTAQVAAAFVSAVSCLDAIVSYARAYRVYAETHPE